MNVSDAGRLSVQYFVDVTISFISYIIIQHKSYRYISAIVIVFSQKLKVILPRMFILAIHAKTNLFNLIFSFRVTV